MEINSDLIWLIIFIVIVALLVSKRKPVSSGFHSGGVHVKPRSDTDKLKAQPPPAPQRKQK